MASGRKSWKDLSFLTKWGVVNNWFCASFLLPMALGSLFRLSTENPMLLVGIVGLNAGLLWLFTWGDVGSVSELDEGTRRVVLWPLYVCAVSALIFAVSALLSTLFPLK
jgi:hypothetical protein